MNIYRQGDVLIVAADVPSQADPIPQEAGRHVLAHGEVTGHAHAVMPKDPTTGAETAFVTSPDGQRFLLVGEGGAYLRHEEHDAILLPPGAYRIIRQREYAPGEIRWVAD